ncbi:MAG: hypothetical protein M2R45_05228 [Verrucomicrobia subdivision 3 bacterium]|nr:hypothetical protein [Limisphaerales bacterium]MCS1417461.1 hypothetical protein [Limisphaerales bacterium]
MTFPEIVHKVLPKELELRGGYLYGNDRPSLNIDINEDVEARMSPRPPRSSGDGPSKRGGQGEDFPVDTLVPVDQ